MGEDESADEGEGDEDLPEQVDAKRARALVAGGKVRVIDIRDADEFAKERITGSKHCEPDDVADELGEDPANSERGLLILCEDGERSAELAEELRGDEHRVTSLEGGFKAWVGDHLPTAPTPDEEYKGPKVALPGAVAPSEPDDDEEEDEDEQADGDGGSSEEAEPDAEGERAEPRSEETEDEEEAERAEER